LQDYNAPKETPIQAVNFCDLIGDKRKRRRRWRRRKAEKKHKNCNKNKQNQPAKSAWTEKSTPEQNTQQAAGSTTQRLPTKKERDVITVLFYKQFVKDNEEEEELTQYERTHNQGFCGRHVDDIHRTLKERIPD
jgi:hypothetical protein